MTIGKEELIFLQKERDQIKKCLIELSYKMGSIRIPDMEIEAKERINRQLYQTKLITIKIMQIMEQTQYIFGLKVSRCQQSELSGSAIENVIDEQEEIQTQMMINPPTLTPEQVEDQQRQYLVDMDIYLADLKKFHTQNFGFGDSVVSSSISAFAMSYLKAIVNEQAEAQSLIQYKSRVYESDLTDLCSQLPLQITQNKSNIKGLVGKGINLLKQQSVRQISIDYDLLQQVFEISLLANLSNKTVNQILNKPPSRSNIFDFKEMCKDLKLKYFEPRKQDQTIIYNFQTKNGTQFFLEENLNDGGFIFQ